jgi:hypothetical protein
MTELPEPLATAPTDAAWQGILDPGESILWQGQPAPRLRLEFRSPFEPLFFIFFTGFSIFWMVMASQAGGFFWMFGLLFFFVGSFALVGQHFWKRYERSRTFYTLTDRRAFIATQTFGTRKLRSYPITPATVVELADGDPGSIFFATETSTDSDGDVTRTKIGFELVEGHRSVYARIREIQSRR